MTWETYSLYLLTVAVFFATPPCTSQLLMISNSVRHGVRRSLATAYGDLTANALQMTAAAFGIATIIAASARAFEVVKWCGVAYLLWIGLKLFFGSAKLEETPQSKSGVFFRLYRQGFITSSTNPYAVMFFAALFPQFIDPAAPIWPQLLILGGTYLLVDGATLIAWGLVAVRAVERFKSLSLAWINRACGSLIVAAAVLLGLTDVEPQEE